jgi:hypothetical protein
MSSSNSSTLSSWDKGVSSPFESLSRRLYPKTVKQALDWAEELWMHHGIYSQAIKKAVRYFITEAQITGDDLNSSTRDKYKKALYKTYKLHSELETVGDNLIAYGNVFTSIHVPFSRQLICPKCYFRAPIRKMEPYFKWMNKKFTGKCPKCHLTVNYIREDKPLPRSSIKPSITYWPPQYMELIEHPMSREAEYFLDVGRYDHLRDGIIQGHLLFLEQTPWEIVEAVLENKMFKFAPGQVLHLKDIPVTSLTPVLKGWGLPKFMAEFETAMLVALLDKYTEGILADYLIPFRVLAPPQSAAGSRVDAMLVMDMAEFGQHIMELIERHRQNPTDWNWLPVPLEYQVLGGEAKNIVPVDIQEFHEQRLLYSMAVPPEFYKGTVQSAAGPILSFKMFEQSWKHLTTSFNEFLTWVAKRHGEILNWESVEVELVPPSLYADPAIREIKLSLAASNEISRETAYRGIGIDVKAEREKIAEEEDDMNEFLEKRAKEQDTKSANKQFLQQPPASAMILSQEEQAAAAPAPGGAPMSPPPMPTGSAEGGDVSLESLMMEADKRAQEIIAMPPPQRREALINLKHSNVTLHAQVKSIIADYEQNASMQGKLAMRQGQMPVQ